MSSTCFLCESNKYYNLYKINGYNIVKCIKCGFIYINEKINNRDLNNYYGNFNYTNDIFVENRVRNDAVLSLNFINKYLKNKSINLLDIGCGKGYFLDLARKIYSNVYGIELSSKFLNYAIKILKLDVYKANIYDFKTNTKFDLITLHQVIEHLCNPKLAIQNCYELLNTNGLLYIATPNINSWLAITNKSKYEYYIPPEHVGYYSPKTLTYLLENNNFNVIKISTWSYPENLSGIIKMLIKRNNISISTEKIHTNNKSTSRLNQNIFKYILFDKVFCVLFYKILNLFNRGTNIHILAIKL